MKTCYNNKNEVKTKDFSYFGKNKMSFSVAFTTVRTVLFFTKGLGRLESTSLIRIPSLSAFLWNHKRSGDVLCKLNGTHLNQSNGLSVCETSRFTEVKKRRIERNFC